MQPYKDLDQNTGIDFYEIRTHSIIIEFKDGSKYLYDYDKPGPKHVDEMKTLAIDGKGLTTYINKHVRENYAKKL